MFNSNTELGQLDLSNVYPTDDLVATALASRQTNNSIYVDNIYSTSSFFLENSNLSLKEKIALEIYERNGPVRDELGTALSLTIIYSLILFTGVIGNICTCIVIVKNKYMHTSVNYYLFSLACSDLLLLVLGLPQEIYMLWQRYPYIFGENFCILRAFTSETSTNASILTITAFTIERYLAICHPLKVQTMSQLSRAIKVIIIIWIIAAVFSIPPAAQLGIVLQKLNTTGEVLPQTAQCVIKYPLKNSFELSALFFFILPMAVISVLYVLIGLALRRSSSISNTNSSASHHHSSPHHLCNQAGNASTKLATANLIQRNSNSIVLDNNSSPTTLIYNESKSVTFCTNEKNKKNSIPNSNEKLDKELNKNLNTSLSNSSRILKQKQLLNNIQDSQIQNPKPSVDEQELHELNNNQLNNQFSNNQLINHNNKLSMPLFLNVNNGTTLAAHRPSDLMNSKVVSSKLNPNSSNITALNSSNSNLNSALTPTANTASNTAITISNRNSIHHHRHHQQTSRRSSVIKMLESNEEEFVHRYFDASKNKFKFKVDELKPVRSTNELSCALPRNSTPNYSTIDESEDRVAAITPYVQSTLNPHSLYIDNYNFNAVFSIVEKLKNLTPPLEVSVWFYNFDEKLIQI